MAEFRVLGPVGVMGPGGPVDLGPAKRRLVLAALILDVGRPVGLDALVDRTWDGDPPREARRILHSHVARIRAALTAAGVGGTSPVPHGSGGYTLAVDPGEVDAHRFRRLVEQARVTDPADGQRRLLRSALDLWHGPALADLPGAWAIEVRAAWDQHRLDATRLWAEAELRHGDPAAVTAEVRALLAAFPFVEPLAALLMRALHADGRTAEALDTYTRTRTRLIEELGTEPGPPLRRLHEAILRGDADSVTDTPVVGTDRPHPTRRPEVVPAQLPPDVSTFTGRAAELSELDRLLTIVEQSPTAVVISAVAGTAGVGKTALAVHWAHRVRGCFPDGQLYVNLRGFDPGGQAMEPAVAVRRFIDALGVPPERIPAELDAQTALYRSLLAGKRVLVMLDNARDAEQARPLLPGTPTTQVVVTSRNQLTGLVAADGAHPLTLDVLSTVEARELLERRLGRDRVAAEPAAVEAIIAGCARLPLALSIAAARAAQTGFPLATLAAELADARDRLGTLDAGDPATQVQAVFSWSYTALTPPAARLFRLLGLHPGPDISSPAAASLAGIPLAEVRPLLAELARLSLTTEHVPGRYGFHDLLRAYTTHLTRTVDTDQERAAATVRLLDHYTHTAHTAAWHLDPRRDSIPVPLTPPAAGATPEQPTDQHAAMGWLDAERLALLAAQRLAAGAGWDTHAWQLAWALHTVLDRRGRWHELAGAWQTALPAADRLPHPAAATAHRLLGRAVTRLGDDERAHNHLQHALQLHTEAADPVGQAHAHLDLGILWARRERPDRALDHSQRALTLFQATGHRRGEADALNGVGWCHVLLGDHTHSLTHCQQALTVYQQVGDRWGEAATWDSLGYAHHHLNHHTQAADCYHHALTLLCDLGDRYNEADTLTRLGDTHRAAGHTDEARAAWTTALDILTDLDHPDAEDVRAKLDDLA